MNVFLVSVFLMMASNTASPHAAPMDARHYTHHYFESLIKAGADGQWPVDRPVDRMIFTPFFSSFGASSLIMPSSLHTLRSTPHSLFNTPSIQEAYEPHSPSHTESSSPWLNTLPVLAVVFLGGWLAARLRERFLIARLRTGNLARLHPCVRRLSKSPHHAHLLVQRWLEERRRVRDGQQDEAASRLILKELQNGLDTVEQSASLQWGWNTRSWMQGLRWTRLALLRLLTRHQPSMIGRPSLAALTPWSRTSGARLERRVFSGDLGSIRLRNARLQDSILQGTGLRRADLSGSSLRRANLHQADLRRARLERVDLCNALLDEADLEYADLSCAAMRRSSFISANLQEANLTRADCERAHFFLCNLAQCVAHQANLTRASFLYAQLRKANLQSAFLYEAEMQFADLKEADLQGADLSRANLLSTELMNANLRDVNLMLTNLYDADLRWANLTNVSWAGTCLLSANLQNAKASDALLSYAFTQAAQLNESQIERIIDWNEDHPDAPWLQDEWEFWWERIEVDDELDWKAAGFRFDDYAFEIHEEIDAVQSYLKTIWKGLD